MNAAKVLDDLKRRFPNEPEYHQAVEEVLSTIEEESLKAIQELSKYIAEMNPCSLESTLSIERFPAGYRIVISIIIEKSKHSKCTSYLSDVSSWICDAKTICSYNVCVHL